MLEKEMREAALTRQIDFIPMDSLGAEIVIIGAGAIGSWVALSLAKMGMVDITVWDHDEVSIENMNCQFYPLDSIGKPKVHALQDMVHRFTGTKIAVMNKKYEGEALSGIVINALDNMATRSLVFSKRSPMVRWIVDPRMSLEQASLNVCDLRSNESIKEYEKSLYDDDAAIQERCTAKSTIYTANLIAGLVSKTVKDIVTGTQDDAVRFLDFHIGKNQMIAWGHKGNRF